MWIVSFLYTAALVLRAVESPAADHHLHLRSAAATENLARLLVAVGDKTPPPTGPMSATQALAALDSAGVERAAVLSVAYQFGFFLLQVANEETKVIAENDYVSHEVFPHRDRLRGFCSVNPLKPYAIREIGRCSALPGMVGLKLHLANSGVDLTRADHRKALRAVFAEADRRNLTIVVHPRMSLDGYSVEVVRRFVHDILPAAPHVTIQVAHMAGWGGFDQVTDAALGVFVEAFRSGALPRDHFYFDLAAVVLPPPPSADSADWRTFRAHVARLAERIRELGTDRVVFASDYPAFSIQQTVGSSRVDLQACKLEYSIVSPK